MNEIEKIKSLAKVVQTATTKQEKSIAISDLHDSLNSQIIQEILDCLEAAEKERDELRAEVPDGWLPIPEKHPTFDPVDLQLSDGSVLCGCVPQSDGDYWWKGPSGEVFIDPKYASVTHWRLAATPKPEGK